MKILTAHTEDEKFLTENLAHKLADSPVNEPHNSRRSL